jgi:hypothetical protein
VESLKFEELRARSQSTTLRHRPPVVTSAGELSHHGRHHLEPWTPPSSSRSGWRRRINSPAPENPAAQAAADELEAVGIGRKGQFKVLGGPAAHAAVEHAEGFGAAVAGPLIVRESVTASHPQTLPAHPDRHWDHVLNSSISRFEGNGEGSGRVSL